MRTLVTSNGQLYQLSVNGKHVVIQRVTVLGSSLHQLGRVQIPFRQTQLWDGCAWVSEALPDVSAIYNMYWQPQSEAAR
jgi:hypothetical protein